MVFANGTYNMKGEKIPTLKPDRNQKQYTCNQSAPNNNLRTCFSLKLDVFLFLTLTLFFDQKTSLYVVVNGVVDVDVDIYFC